MFSTKSLAMATAVLSLVSDSIATFDATAKTNLAMYWGAGTNELPLTDYCQEDSAADIIPIGFINSFPAQNDGGWKMTTGDYSCFSDDELHPEYGSDAQLQDCFFLKMAIPTCQANGKKILLSLGGQSGGASDYQLNGTSDGIEFAQLLWGAYGPYNRTSEYALANGARPFGQDIAVDGFDFDIELAPEDFGEGYISMVNELRKLMDREDKTYLITAAPECGLEDSKFGSVIEAVKFDALFVQFYNNNNCSASNHETFNYEQWTSYLNGNILQGTSPTANANTKIYIGLPASPGGTAPGYSADFLSQADVQKLVFANSNDDQFGGVMLWEATGATNEVDNGVSYDVWVKTSCLDAYTPPVTTMTSTTTTSSSTTSTTETSTTTSETSTTATSTELCTASCMSGYFPVGDGTCNCTPGATITPTTTSTTSETTSTAATETSTTETSSSLTTSACAASCISGYTPVGDGSCDCTSTSGPTATATSTTSETASTTTTETSATDSATSTTETSTSETSTVEGPTTTSSSSYSPSGGFTSPTASLTSTNAPYGNYSTSTTEGPSSSTDYTTSTIRSTSLSTIYSCAPTVSDCPYNSVTTIIVDLYTTVCPVSNEATVTSAPGTVETGSLLTSTAYITSTRTISKCPASVTNCPLGSVTTEIIPVYTTLVPASPTSLPGGVVSVQITTTLVTLSKTTSFTTFTLVPVVYSTVEVKPLPITSALGPIKVVVAPLGTGHSSTTSPAVTTATGPASTATPSPIAYAASAGVKIGGVNFVLITLVISSIAVLMI